MLSLFSLKHKVLKDDLIEVYKIIKRHRKDR